MGSSKTKQAASTRSYALRRQMYLSLSASPHLIYGLEAVKLRLQGAAHRQVGKSTRLVIEGPPRCGNSSALRLVTQNNPDYKQRVATHLHRPFQLYFAQKLQVPAIVMLRCPEQSTVSHASLLCQLGQVRAEDDRDRERLLKMCITEYLAFVRSLQRISFRHIVLFETYITAPQTLIEYINQAYDLDLKAGGYDDTKSEKAHVFPSAERDRLKEGFARVTAGSAQVQHLMQDARGVFDDLVAQRYDIHAS